LLAGNNKTIADSGQLFDSVGDAVESIELVRRLAGDTPSVRGVVVGEADKAVTVDRLLDESGESVEHQLRRTLERIRAFQVTVPLGADRDALRMFEAEIEDVLRRFAAERVSRSW
jgi:hypothetical protein